MREYAFETQSFVAACSAYMSSDVPEDFSEEELGFNVAAGGSMLINPAGIVKAGPLVGEEGLLTADFERDERRATKAYFDAMGHYTRWDAVSLDISDETLDPVAGRGRRGGDGRSDGRLSAAVAQELADEHGIPIETVEDVAEAVSDRSG
nr:nitrilase-related carbon-nitrogen hydrolase [Natronomonas sp. LN261]